MCKLSRDVAHALAAGLLSGLARRVELTGGHVAAAKRLARAAAYSASRVVTEQDVIEAVAFEHDKVDGATSAACFRGEGRLSYVEVSQGGTLDAARSRVYWSGTR